ncbi:SPOR domain-containing protein [Microbacterium sp. YY-01]|uniref:SPOR domain-containing protein n=1 Tax=Microbacterium sp. YY-01 TaxID=3421634 RepID=UPI003D182570
MSEERKYWFNMNTRQVEHGMLSPAAYRVGPFDTAEEAERAPQKLQERAQAWEEEEQAEDDWGAPAGGEQ